MGLGHYYRQRSLAQAALERGLHVTMLMHDDTPTSLLDELEIFGILHERSQHQVASQQERAWLLSQLDNNDTNTIVIDGYHFSPEYIESLHATNHTIAVFDDDGTQCAMADFLINLNLGAEKLPYPKHDDSQKLLGAQYTLLRPQFRTMRARIDDEPAPAPAEISRVLVTMGGGDVTDFIITALDGLVRAHFRGTCDVLLGATASKRQALSEKLATLPFNCKVHVQIEEVARLMSKQDLAICSAGGTSWELCCLGIPMMQVMLFDNQQVVMENLARRDICTPLGTRATFTEEQIARCFVGLDTSPEKRTRMRAAGMALIDGYGAHRLLTALFPPRS